MDHIAAFRDAIEASGLVAPEKVKDDGKRHRFSSSGKKQDDAGWYILYGGEYPAGAFGCWRSGLSERWQYRERERMTQEEVNAWRRRMAQLEAQREAERQRARAQAAMKALRLWNLGRDGVRTAHPYLARKLIPGIGARVFRDLLMIPMRHGLQGLVGLQVVQPDGSRNFLKGTPSQGAYMVLGKIRRGMPAVICEGYATGVSIHLATGFPVVVAFSSGNLSAVARKCMQALAGVQLLIGADDDAFTVRPPSHVQAGQPWNPGLEAAQAVGLPVILPVWGRERGRGTDFNDLHAAEGLEAVKSCFVRHPGA